MATRLGNIAALFKEGRTRTIILVTFLILLIAVGVGVYSMRGKKGVEASAGVTSAPGGIQSIPFSAPNKAYANLQEQQNKQQAKQAEQAGGSAIPTIVDSGKDIIVTPTSDVGPGFTALNREQNDAGTFEAKTFGKNKQCPTPVVVDKTNSLGTPIYDKNGRLIGYAGADGKVRDLSGNIIGTLGPDGTVRDSSGKIIGQPGKALAGTPVYDDKGNLIGYVSEDGKVRDANGRILGAVGPDGKVRDITGALIGTLGTPVYDKNGKLIGFAGPDGKVRDASGKIIGSVDPDGTVRDLNGNIIGKAGSISPGTPVYDANGNAIGAVGPDGFARDANGNIIGKVGLDGQIRDVNGNVMAGVVKPEVIKPSETEMPSNASSTSLTQEQSEQQKKDALAEKQDAISKDQNLTRAVEQKQQAMSSQASQLLSAWTPPSQQYVAGQEEHNQDEKSLESEKGVRVTIGERGSKTEKLAGPVFIKAGSVYYAVINTAINSDEPGPILATIINGDYKGGRLLGTMVNQGKAVLLSFNTLTMPQFSKSISINAVAIDQNTARTALSTETDNHYLLRYGTLFAASFMQGYGQAVSSAGTVTNTGPLGNTTTVHSQLSPKQEFFAALGNVGTQFGNQMNSVYSTPPTVYVAPGTSVGILFMGDVSLPTS